ncbi:hypothetical protein CDL12_16912 [Handroanthus impetiginosus]|uniref:Dehydrin n=1 Tax=Handroanthus impetiginosus TaxID=429701 RepID=A0A2G9GZQ6_9LAMI|nr:hypothetical protein CDL12_16912 [Handroanthus impetiginosus]
MAEQYPKAHANNSSDMPSEDSTKEPAGCFGFMAKKDQKSDQDEDLVMSDLNAAKETKEEKHTLMDVLQRAHSNSSSSGEEKVEEGGERKKKKKKKGLKETIKGKISGDEDGAENTEQKETCNIPMDKCSTDEEEKKGILEKIKEKLPGQQYSKGAEDIQTPPACEHSLGSDMHAKEKKGIIDKIKEKLPGQHKTNENHDVVN